MDSNRAMPTACEMPKTQTLQTKGCFLPPLLPVDSQESVLEYFHAPIRVTMKRCACPRCTRITDGIAAKLLRCGIASEALRQNMPLWRQSNEMSLICRPQSQSGSEKGVFWRRGLSERTHPPEIRDMPGILGALGSPKARRPPPLLNWVLHLVRIESSLSLYINKTPCWVDPSPIHDQA